MTQKGVLYFTFSYTLKTLIYTNLLIITTREKKKINILRDKDHIYPEVSTKDHICRFLKINVTSEIFKMDQCCPTVR